MNKHPVHGANHGLSGRESASNHRESLYDRRDLMRRPLGASNGLLVEMRIGLFTVRSLNAVHACVLLE